MRVGVLDIGANTAHLVVFERALERVAEDRAMLGLGAEIEASGDLSKQTLAEVERAARRMVATARSAGAARIEVLRHVAGAPECERRRARGGDSPRLRPRAAAALCRGRGPARLRRRARLLDDRVRPGRRL